MPFDGTAASTTSMLKPCTGAAAASVHADVRRESPTAIRLTSMPAGQVSRRPESVASTIAILRRARDLIANEQNWCKGSFARSWFDVPVLPQSTFARRFCAIGAIMRAGRELQLQTPDACLALQRQTMHPVEDWNDDPARTHADVIAAFDAAVMAISDAPRTAEQQRTMRRPLAFSGL
jgi:hypothetical protein